MLEIDQVGHRYGGRIALQSVSMSVDQGVTAIVGANGAGKSTLLSALAGARKPTYGSISVAGLDPYRHSMRKRALFEIGFMPQQFAFMPSFRVWEFVAYMGWLRGLSWKDSRGRTDGALESASLAHRGDVKMSTLSGGMLRRVGLAQAIVTSPNILLLDEPTTGLDPQHRAQTRRLVGEMSAGRTVMMSSHLVEDVEALADRLIVLDHGRVVFDGSVSDLKAQGSSTTAEDALLTIIQRAAE